MTVSSLEFRVPSQFRTNSKLVTRNCKAGCGDETRTRIISFTRRVLCYPIELRRNLVDWEGFKPSQEVCRTSMLSVTSPARSDRVRSPTVREGNLAKRALAYDRASDPLCLVAVGGVEPPTSR